MRKKKEKLSISKRKQDKVSGKITPEVPVSKKELLKLKKQYTNGDLKFNPVKVAESILEDEFIGKWIKKK